MFFFLKEIAPTSVLVVSPITAQISVSVAVQGAKGSTATDIINCLHFNGSTAEAIAANFHKFQELLEVASSPLKIVHKLYAADPLRIDAQYNDAIAKTLYSTAESINFNNSQLASTIVNTWIASKTNNNTQSVISASDIYSNTSILLVSGVHFKGLWNEEFHPRNSFEGTFHMDMDIIEIDFMRSTVIN